MLDQGVTISEIRSGGQTGVDEAGIIAAQRLGIPSSVHAPRGFVFRNKEGQDIRDERAFKERFKQQVSTSQANGQFNDPKEFPTDEMKYCKGGD